MKFIGKTTIHPILFYSGKLSGYFTWIILFLGLLGIDIFKPNDYGYTIYFSIILMAFGLVITTLSLLDLGNSTRLGLPVEGTEFICNGLYRFSRNPMYVGFNLITIASMVNSMNIIIFILGLYSIIIYHFIILGEEKFMEERFQDAYLDFKKSVRRYI
jgi:protein-S-isoprenylcysteine O-methyltransferase Ste14